MEYFHQLQERMKVYRLQHKKFLKSTDNSHKLQQLMSTLCEKLAESVT